MRNKSREGKSKQTLVLVTGEKASRNQDHVAARSLLFGMRRRSERLGIGPADSLDGQADCDERKKSSESCTSVSLLFEPKTLSPCDKPASSSFQDDAHEEGRKSETVDEPRIVCDAKKVVLCPLSVVLLIQQRDLLFRDRWEAFQRGARYTSRLGGLDEDDDVATGG